jgi:glucose-6-phosphate 1-epimerase
MSDPIEAAIQGVAGLRQGEFQGLPALLIETSAARAAVSLFGAQVLSYAPMNHDDLLWVSPSTSRPPKPIRGGIPLCWPWFGRQGVAGSAPQHGVVRTAPWRLVYAQARDRGETALSFAAADPALHTMRVELAVTIGATLIQALKTTNTSDSPATLTQAFHTYFRVGDAAQSSIEGIDGLTYLDKPASFARRAQSVAWRLEGECDRVYVGARGDYALVDPVLRRRIRIRSTNSKALVVWNPGPERVKAIGDIPPQSWRDYLCLEVANAGDDVVTLAAGSACVIAQTLAVEPL